MWYENKLLYALQLIAHKQKGRARKCDILSSFTCKQFGKMKKKKNSRGGWRTVLSFLSWREMINIEKVLNNYVPTARNKQAPSCAIFLITKPFFSFKACSNCLSTFMERRKHKTEGQYTSIFFHRDKNNDGTNLLRRQRLFLSTIVFIGAVVSCLFVVPFMVFMAMRRASVSPLRATRSYIGRLSALETISKVLFFAKTRVLFARAISFCNAGRRRPRRISSYSRSVVAIWSRISFLWFRMFLLW